MKQQIKCMIFDFGGVIGLPHDQASVATMKTHRGRFFLRHSDRWKGMERDRRKPFTYEITPDLPRHITEGDASYNTKIHPRSVICL